MVLTTMLASLPAATPAEAVGTSFTYQGQLSVNGAPADGVCNLQFALFAVASGGSALATVGPLAVTIDKGLFTAALDFGANFPGADRWLEIRAACPGNATQVLAPRQPITAAPYALFANTAGTVPDASLTGAKIADGAVTSAKLADGTIATANLGDSAVTSAKIANGTIATGDLANGAVTTAKIGDGQVTGAKLVTPLRLTSAAANTTIGALDGTSTGSNGVGVSGKAGTGVNSAGVFGSATAGAGVRGESLDGIGVLGDGAEFGVKGTSASGEGVMGVSTAPTGTAVVGIASGIGMPTGVRGESSFYGVTGSGDYRGVSGYGRTGVEGITDDSDGTGVAGVSRAANDANGEGVSGSANQGIGVAGSSIDGTGVNGSSRNGTGAIGRSTNGVGVIGRSDASYGVHGIGQAQGIFGDGVRGTGTGSNSNGVHGIADNGPNAYGVYGESSSGYAGYFNGKVTITGTLSKAAGSFIIDHPLDPANKYLSHSFVESPDMKNIYDGIAVLDADGRADVELPDWFQALNRDFRYQLTCVGAFAPVYVAEKIHDNRFQIAGGAAGQEISWQVTGIRQDAYANAHRIVVEENKPAEEVGHYLHPVELGMPASMSMTAVKDSPAKP